MSIPKRSCPYQRDLDYLLQRLHRGIRKQKNKKRRLLCEEELCRFEFCESRLSVRTRAIVSPICFSRFILQLVSSSSSCGSVLQSAGQKESSEELQRICHRLLLLLLLLDCDCVDLRAAGGFAICKTKEVVRIIAKSRHRFLLLGFELQKRIFIIKSRRACCCKIASRSSLRIGSEVEDRL